AAEDANRLDTDALASLVSIAAQRCLLLERLSEAELLRRSESFKTALLSSVSHDMRTPLSAITASASSLVRYGDELAEETRQDLLGVIEEQCGRLNRYTSNLLNLGRLQAGLDPGGFMQCDALEALGTAISHARLLAPRQQFEKLYSVDAAIVQADPVMLEQVFYNVLENAVRYGSEEWPVLIRASRADGLLLVEVEDKGRGIAPADRDRVFERFYRAGSESGSEGSGLGLSIAKGFTEAFGGSISAHGRGEGQGTVIAIRLPLTGGEAASP
ncbi:MAG TPA: ATP-binding protein, partial [Allosphingosinicella sp.]|nr:ATP-binding protein [Allosphingosinicella sp.]